MALTDPKVKQAKSKEKAYKLSDEKGLYLHVKTNGGKYWRLKYRHLGKEKILSIGVYPEVSLKDAREARDKARLLIKENIDPSAEKKNKKLDKIDESVFSFRNISLEWHSKVKIKWGEEHTNRVKNILEKELIPEFGHKHIGQVTAPDLLAAIRKIEEREAFETAAKSRRIAGQVLQPEYLLTFQ